MTLALGAAAAGGNGGGGVILTNSADFEFNNDEYFSFSPSGNGSDIKTGSVSVWLNEEGRVGSTRYIFTGREDADTADRSIWRFQSGNQLLLQNVEVSRFSEQISASTFTATDWHHWLLVWDTTLATAGDRIKAWRDGVSLTLNNSGSGAPLQNEGTWFGRGSSTMYIGRQFDSNINHWDGQMADFHYIDGQAKVVSDFVDFSGSDFTILDYGGTYGTHGARLRFDNGADLGEDSSGNGNDWTNNATVTQSTDVPTSPVS